MKVYCEHTASELQGGAISYLGDCKDMLRTRKGGRGLLGISDRWKVKYSHHSSQFRPTQTRARGSATGTHANRLSAKRIRDQFGDGPEVTEYPSKKAALDLAACAVMQAAMSKHWRGWVVHTVSGSGTDGFVQAADVLSVKPETNVTTRTTVRRDDEKRDTFMGDMSADMSGFMGDMSAEQDMKSVRLQSSCK